MIDFSPPPKLWTPPKPAIIRHAADIQRASFIPGMAGVVGFAKKLLAASIAMVDHQISTSTAGVQTFTCNAGLLGIKKDLIICSSAGASGATARSSSIKVDSVSATKLLEDQSSNSVASMFIIGGITADSVSVEITWSPAPGGVGVGVFAAYGLQSRTAYFSGTTNSNNGAINMNARAGGVAVGYKMAIRSSGASPTYTWTNMTERFDETIVVNSYSHTGACDNISAGTVGLAVTASGTSVANSMMLVASFR